MISRIALFLAVFLFASAARAERCGDEARAWVARCSKSTGVAFDLAACPSSVAILSTKDLRIELSTSEKAFQRVGAYGLSPIGDFADWQLEPESRRKALEAAVSCVKAEAPVSLLAADAPAPQVTIPKPAHLPWLLIAATALSLGACVRRVRPTVIAIVALGLVFFLRQLMQPFAFFHQNGQGPQWIEFAFRGDAGEYGPGYGEVFHWVSHVRRPERGVMALQEFLAATIPLSVYAIARSGGATGSTPLVLAAAAAFDPVLARVGRSESYFSLMAALIFAAAAVVTSTDRRHRWLGLLGAALLVAQAARVHPLAWVPCALVPLVLLCRPGRPLDRVKRTAVAAAVIGLVALPLVLPTLRVALHGHLGSGFMPGARANLSRTLLPVGIAVVLLAALAYFRPKIGIRAWVFTVVVAAALATNVLANDAKVVHAAHLHLYVPALIAAISAVKPSIALSIAAMVHVVTERPLRVLPTDARELDWAMQWREELPPGAKVAALQRVEQRLLLLPLLGEGLPVAVTLDATAPKFYYRSSLCFTPEGAPECVIFENTHKLKVISARRFPSIASLPWAPLPPGEIEVALFAVE